LLHGRIGLYSTGPNGLEFEGRRRYFLTINEQLIGAISLLQQQWISKRTHKNFIKLKKALVMLQARGRHLYFWGITDECSEIVLKVLEVWKIIASIQNAVLLIKAASIMLPSDIFLLVDRFN
jgi:hypothetical protein